MVSKTFILMAAIAYVEARFGQEQVPIAAISAVKGGSPGQAATIAGAAISDLLGAASSCAKLSRADEIFTKLGGGADALAAAIGMVTAEKNTNPSANNNTQNVCGDASLPATAELRGITPLIDPAVDVDGKAAALSKSSAAAPLKADGLSVFDLMSQNGLGDLVKSQAAGGGAAGGGAAAAAGGAAAGKDAGNVAAAAPAAGGAAAGGVITDGAAANATAPAAGKGKGKGKKNGNKAAKAKAAKAKAAAAAAANACGNVPAAAAAAGDVAGNAAAANGTAAAAAPAAGAAKDNNNKGKADKGKADAGAAAGNAATGNAAAGNAAAATGDAAAGAATGATGAAAAAGGDFGSCTPTITFQGGEGNRPATEFTFQIADPVARGGQGEALNPDIITNALCNQLTNVCKASAAGVAKCKSAQAAVKGGPRNKSTADKFNTLIGFPGAVTNPKGGPADVPAAGAAAGAAKAAKRSMRRGVRA